MLRHLDSTREVLDPAAMLAKLEAGNLSIGTMLCEALHAVRNHLGMEVAFVAEFSEGARIFRHVDGRTEHLTLCVGDSGPLEESYCQRVVDGRRLWRGLSANRASCREPHRWP